MTCIMHYNSPLGGILLTADGIGLTGLWFDGEKYYADNLPQEREVKETPVLSEAARWLDIYFAGKSRILLRRCILSARNFAVPCGSFFCRYLTVPLLHTEILQRRLRRTWGLRKCRRRRSAGRWGTMKFPSLFRVTVWWAQTGA